MLLNMVEQTSGTLLGARNGQGGRRERVKTLVVKARMWLPSCRKAQKEEVFGGYVISGYFRQNCSWFFLIKFSVFLSKVILWVKFSGRNCTDPQYLNDHGHFTNNYICR